VWVRAKNFCEKGREREREEREREKGDMEDLQYSHVQVEAIEKPV